MMLFKCCTQYASKCGKLSSGTGLEKVFSFQSQRRAVPNECSNYCTIALISHVIKVMLKILQARIRQYMNQELPNVQSGFKKAEEAEIKLPTFIGT